MKATNIAGITLGTRVVGLAILTEGESGEGVLVDWQVKTFPDTFSKAKVKTILAAIRRLCDYHPIAIVAIKKVDPLRSSPQLDRLIRALVRQCKREGRRVEEYSLSELDYETGKKHLSKSELVEHVVHKHSQLRPQYHKEQNNRSEYYVRMFEAVAIADHCWRKVVR